MTFFNPPYTSFAIINTTYVAIIMMNDLCKYIDDLSHPPINAVQHSTATHVPLLISSEISRMKPQFGKSTT